VEPTPYDEIPYPSSAHVRTDPSKLAAVIKTMGYEPPPPLTAKILDLGCGDGLNALTLASIMPESFVVGVDLSSVQVAKGEALRKAAGIENARIEVGDVFTMPLDGETYDYILIHGVYSWVPQVVALQMLKLVAARLKPGGICYVSYDGHTLGPFKTALNRLLRRATDAYDDPQQKLAIARHILATISDNEAPDSMTKQFTAFEAKVYIEAADNFVIHDILAEYHRSLPALEFEAECNTAGLTMLGEGGMNFVFDHDLTEDARALLSKLGSTASLRAEMLDHFRGRMFRATLVVRQDAPPKVREGELPLDEFWYSCASIKRIIDPEEGLPFSTEYTARGEARLRTDDASTVAIIEALRAAWPRELNVHEIAEASGTTREVVHTTMPYLLACELVSAYATPQQAAQAVPEKPVVSSLVRALAARGDEAIPSQRIVTARITDDASRYFLTQLDGTKSAEDMMKLMAEKVGEPYVPGQDERARGAFQHLWSLNLFAA